MKNAPVHPWGPWLLASAVFPMTVSAALIALYAAGDSSSLPMDRAELWWLWFIVPVIGGAYLYALEQRRRGLGRFASESLGTSLACGVQPGRQALRAGCVVLGLTALVTAILGPRWGVYIEKQSVQGIDVVVAVDVSKSMWSTDVSPNRFEAARQMLRRQFVERSALQRVGRLALLAFAGTASLRVPLSTDSVAFREKLESLQVGSVARGGTAIGEAIRRAGALFERSAPDATKVLLLVTDGEDHEGTAVAEAKKVLDSSGIRVFTIGVGDPGRTAGAQVPSAPAAGSKPLLHEGQIVFSRPDVDGLRQIAEAGGGRYATLDDLPALVDAISGLRRAKLGVEERQRHRPRYQWFVAAALLLFSMETWIGERSRRESPLPRRAWEQEVMA